MHLHLLFYTILFFNFLQHNKVVKLWKLEFPLDFSKYSKLYITQNLLLPVNTLKMHESSLCLDFLHYKWQLRAMHQPSLQKSGNTSDVLFCFSATSSCKVRWWSPWMTSGVNIRRLLFSCNYTQHVLYIKWNCSIKTMKCISLFVKAVKET